MALIGTWTKAELALVLVVVTIAAATSLVEDMAINRTAAATRGSLRIDITLLMQAFSSLCPGDEAEQDEMGNLQRAASTPQVWARLSCFTVKFRSYG
jgi:hypothetical protein